MLSSVVNRRSVRKYKNTSVPRHLLEEILQAGRLAPSSKNRQPWRFIVTSGSAKKELLAAMEKGLAREKEHPLLLESAPYRGSAESTLKIMEQAPVVIFVVNPLGSDVRRSLNPEEHIYELCNAQSVGAAIENMTLTATGLGLGSLWICDTYFAYDELKAQLGADGELMAALAIGYADEAPSARPKLSLDELVEWRIDF